MSAWRQRRSNTDCPVGSGARRHVVIAGAGIVGACLARLLAERGQKVTIIERGGSGDDDDDDDDEPHLSRSTGLASGFASQQHTTDTLRILAQRSVAHYKTIPGAFANVGSMEVASTERGLATLQDRLALAQQTSIRAIWLTAEQAIVKEPRLLSAEQGILGAVFYPDDGIANTQRITKHELALAKKQDNIDILYDTEVLRVEPGQVIIAGRQLPKRCNDVVVCCGLWARKLVPDLPMYAVAQPYVHSAPHENPTHIGGTPIIRWPERQVYMHDHGPCFGLGTYGYRHVPATNLADSDGRKPSRRATMKWVPAFTSMLQKSAQRILPIDTLAKFDLAPSSDDNQPSNAFGVLSSVTPDGLPLAGLIQGQTLFVCAAVWATHAYGTAKVVYDEIIRNRLTERDKQLKEALDPYRFGTMKEEKEVEVAARHDFLAARLEKELLMAERGAAAITKAIADRLRPSGADEEQSNKAKPAAEAVHLAKLERRASMDAAINSESQCNNAGLQYGEAAKKEATDSKLQERAALDAELLQRALATYDYLYIAKEQWA